MLKCAVLYYKAHPQVILLTVIGMVFDLLISALKTEELENLPTLPKAKIFVEAQQSGRSNTSSACAYNSCQKAAIYLYLDLASI